MKDAYILHLVAAAIGAGSVSLRVCVSPQQTVLDCEPALEPPTSSRWRQRLARGLQLAQKAGARVVSGELPRLELGWPERSHAGEHGLLQRRCRLAPVPLSVNDVAINPPLDLGPAVVARELQGGPAAPVSSQAALRSVGQCPGLWAELALGGGWYFEGLAARLDVVVDGLSYHLDEFESGCTDLRAVVVAGDLEPDDDLQELQRDQKLVALMAQLRQQLEAAKSNLVRAFPIAGAGGAALWHLLREIMAASRSRGELGETLDLCQRVVAHPELSEAGRAPFRGFGAGLATRLERHEQALELAGGAGDLDILGTVQLEAGQPDSAQQTLLRREQQRREEEQEPHRLAPTLLRLSAVSLVQGNASEAERYGKRAVARYLEGVGENSPEVALAYLRLSQVYLHQDRLEEGRRLVEQALGVLHQDDLRAGQGLLYAALFDLLADRLEAAREGARWALQLLQPTLGSGHPEISCCHFMSGLISLRLQHPEEGRERLRESLKLRIGSLGEGHTDVAAVRVALAQARLREGQHERARDHAQRALHSYQHALGPRHPATARARDLLGQALAAAQDLAGAERETREALRTFGLHDQPPGFRDSAGTVCYHWWRGADDAACQPPLVLPPRRLGQEQEDLALTQAHLARILRLQGRTEEADASAREALRIRSCRGKATLIREAGALLRLGPEALAVRLSLQAPGRTLCWLRLDTARGRVALAAEAQPGDRDLMLVLIEPEKKLLQNDSAIFTRPFQEGEHSFLLYAADQGSSRVGAIPYVVTAGFREGPPLRVPVRL